jgi:hypothetical protein
MVSESSSAVEARQVEKFVGLATYGAASAGIGGIAVAIVTLVMGRFEAAGTALIAAGVGFGTLANALLRK